jgi:hypothetical protein
MTIRTEGGIGPSSLQYWLGGIWRVVDKLLRCENEELT